jgi:O-antigen ligase
VPEPRPLATRRATAAFLSTPAESRTGGTSVPADRPKARVIHPPYVPLRSGQTDLVERKNPLALFLLSFYFFLLSSQANQFLGAYAGISFPLVAIVFSLLFLAYLSGENKLRFTASPFIVPWTAMVLWWVAASVLGMYPRRSTVFMLTGYGLRIQILPFIICAIGAEFFKLRKALAWVAPGLGVVLFFCFRAGQMQEGRFFLPNTSLANGNDLAMHIVLFGCLTLVLLAGNRKARIFVIAGMPLALYYVLKTGSRANMLTVITLALLGFLLLPARQKLAMAALALFLPLLVVPFLPGETTARLVSFFSAPAEESADIHQAELISSALDSTNARIELQRRAIELTERHFMFGIGPQNFADAVEDMVRERGERKSGWQVAHNSYLEVSAETGIPGLIFYVWNILLCLKLNFVAFRRFRADKSAAIPFLVTFSLFMATFTYAFGIFFCTIPYDFQLALLVGLTASIHVFFNARPGVTTPPATGGNSVY